MKHEVPQLIRLGLYEAPPVSEVSPYRIAAGRMVVELITAGVVYFEGENGDRKLGCGALFWHMTGDRTVYRTEPEAPYRCLVLVFATKKQNSRLVPRLSLIGDHQKVREFVQEVQRAYHDESVDRTVLGEYAYAWLRWESQLSLRNNLASGLPVALERALEFLEANFRQANVGVRQLAESGELSEPHFYAIFRAHLRQSPHQFLNARRIREAKWLLTSSNATIKAIASECGFLNIETFYRAFKRAVGTTPHHFRESHGTGVLASL